MLDIDILDEGAARLVEGIARHTRCQRSGPTRIGLPPKRAIRCARCTLKKIVSTLVAPNSKPGDKPHKIEILGDGQQIVVAGIHPDTGGHIRGRTGDRRSTRRALRCRLLSEAEAQAIVRRLRRGPW